MSGGATFRAGAIRIEGSELPHMIDADLADDEKFFTCSALCPSFASFHLVKLIKIITHIKMEFVM